MNTNPSLARVTERQLLRDFADLIAHDRVNTARLLAYIAEIDERKLWAKHACSSMFVFCMERFHMSESVTAKRIRAARAARRFPIIVSMVARGELHLSGINQLSKHLTEDNHRAVLLRAKHKSSREIEVLVAELAPRPDVPSRVRALPRSGPASGQAKLQSAVESSPQSSPASSSESTSRLATESPSPEDARPSSRPDEPRGRIEALAPRRFRIEITVDQSTHDKLRALQDLLRHQLPSGDPAPIVERAIEMLLNDTLRKKAAVTTTARATGSTSAKRTRAIPAAVRREVWKRDVGRCAFVDAQGRRCRATSLLEYHHEIPYGKGGGHQANNIALRCRAHNQAQADLDFGREFMRDKRRGTGEQAARPVDNGPRAPSPASVGDARPSP